MTSRVRVFVSSIVQGFAAHREAARKAIEQAGAEPILVNEDFGSQNASSRNACLDAVASADIFVLVIGAQVAADRFGRLVIEEELEEARQRRLRILVFIEDGEQDGMRDSCRRRCRIISMYFRARFRGAGGLGRELARALPPVIETLQRPAMNPDELSSSFQRPYTVGEQTTLRFVLSPERQERSSIRSGWPPMSSLTGFLSWAIRNRSGCSAINGPKNPHQIRNDSLILEQPGRQRLAPRNSGSPAGTERERSHDRFERNRSK